MELTKCSEPSVLMFVPPHAPQRVLEFPCPQMAILSGFFQPVSSLQLPRLCPLGLSPNHCLALSPKEDQKTAALLRIPQPTLDIFRALPLRRAWQSGLCLLC